MVRRSVTSWRQLPFNLYQIRTKFRDEIRPRFGLLRGPRVPDEGRLLLRRRPEGARRPLREDGEGVPDDLRALRPRVRRSSRPTRAPSAARPPRSSWSSPTRARTRSSSPRTGDYGANVEKAITGAAPRAVGRGGGEAVRPAPTPRRPASSRREGQAKHLGTTVDRITNTMLYEAIRADETSFVCAVLIRGDLDDQRGQAPEGARRRSTCGSSPRRGSPRSPAASPASSGRSAFKPRRGRSEVPVYVDRSMENARNVWCGANDDGLHHSNVSVRRDVKVARRRPRGRDGARRRPVADGNGRPPHQAGHRGRATSSSSGRSTPRR